MTTKLTLRLDEQLIAAAKDYAQAHGRSVSALVADYFAQLAGQSAPATSANTGPLTTRLRGALRGATATEADHKAHLAARQQ